jgi:hypothetical protein
MSNMQDDAKDAADKMRAAGKAYQKKMEDPGSDQDAEYNKQKGVEKADDV